MKIICRIVKLVTSYMLVSMKGGTQPSIQSCMIITHYPCQYISHAHKTYISIVIDLHHVLDMVWLCGQGSQFSRNTHTDSSNNKQLSSTLCRDPLLGPLLEDMNDDCMWQLNKYS